MRLGPGEGGTVAQIAGILEEAAEKLLSKEDVFVLMPAAGCLFIGQPLLGGVAIVHQFAAEGARGSHTLRAGRAAVAWAWANTDLFKLVGLTPTLNRPACIMAQALGFRREGLLTKALRDGQGVQDLVVFGLSRPEGG